jgi:hypothetical protein
VLVLVVPQSVVSHHSPPLPPPHTNTFSRSTAPISHFDSLSHIDINLSVANSSMPGEGTVKSVLSYCGEPIRSIQGGRELDVSGWKSLASRRFPGMTSNRWCSDVSVPDVDIFTAHISPPRRSQHVYPKVISTTQNKLKDFRFRAGVESSLSMLGLSLFASLKAKKILPSSVLLTDFSSSLLQLNKVLNVCSSGKGQGGMTVHMDGTTKSPTGQETRASIRWGLSANADTGPEIPCTPAIIIASKLLHLYKYRNAHVSSSQVVDSKYQPGARVCADMVSLLDFTDAIQQDALDIQQYVSYHADEAQASSSSSTAWESLSPTFTALDLVSQEQLPDAICKVHAIGGVVMGELLVSMSRFPLVRLSSAMVGLPVPGWLTQQKTYKILVNMEKQKWQRLCTPADSRQDRASSVDIFSSSFSSRRDDQLLRESVLGGFLEFSMQQKAVTHLRDEPVRPARGERPWVYDGFQGVCVQASVLFGLLPLPSWLTPAPCCRTAPHADGLGWDLLVTLSLPLLGEVVRYEGPLRIAALVEDDAPPLKGDSGQREQLLGAIESTYGVQTTPSASLQKVSPNRMANYLYFVYLFVSVLCFVLFIHSDPGKVPPCVRQRVRDLRLLCEQTHRKRQRRPRDVQLYARQVPYRIYAVLIRVCVMI